MGPFRRLDDRRVINLDYVREVREVHDAGISGERTAIIVSFSEKHGIVFFEDDPTFAALKTWMKLQARIIIEAGQKGSR